MADDEIGLMTAGGKRLASDSPFVYISDRTLCRCYSLAGYLLGDASEAELARRLEARATLPDGAALESWLDRILVNVCLDRSRRRRAIRFVPMESAGDMSGTDPFRDFASRDDVGRALRTLSPEHRAVVLLRFWSDLQVDEIARRVGCPSGTVKSRLHKAMAALRAELQRDQ